MMDIDLTLTTADYIMIAVILGIPLVIGIVFAVRDHKRATREEYLLGGRRMSMIPVTLSLFVTFQSAISLIGVPSDLYTYGAMFSVFYIGICLSYIVGYFIMVPVIYPLKLTSMYEYLYLRFESQSVRMMSTVIGMLQTIFYMAIALLSPAIALQETASIPLWVSVVMIGVIGTVYTAIGGIKSVVWTDTFQTLIVFIGLFAIIIKGSLAVGGIGEALDIARAEGRASFNVFDPDPRTRHTWWGMVFGALLFWMANIFNQSTVQRVSGMTSLKAAKISHLLNIPMNLLYGAFLLIVGFVVYAYFDHVRCDPFAGGILTNRNQVVPFYVLQVFRDSPGMSGLFMGTLFSGSLSTLSSGINALAANTVEDILGRMLHTVQEHYATFITKLIVMVYGVIITGLAYGASFLTGPVTQIAVSVIGAFGSPILGMCLLGCLVPWANKYGALAGGASSLVLNTFITICRELFGRRAKILPPAPIDICYSAVPSNITSATFTSLRFTTEESTTSSSTGKGGQYDFGFFLFDISYEWGAFIGTMICMVVGLVVSYTTRGLIRSKPKTEFIAPVCRRVWSLPDPSNVVSSARRDNSEIRNDADKPRVKKQNEELQVRFHRPLQRDKDTNDLIINKEIGH